MSDMRRRGFVTLLGGAAAARRAPSNRKMPVVGFLSARALGDTPTTPAVTPVNEEIDP